MDADRSTSGEDSTHREGESVAVREPLGNSPLGPAMRVPIPLQKRRMYVSVRERMSSLMEDMSVAPAKGSVDIALRDACTSPRGT
jgi:hypothetical protein